MIHSAVENATPVAMATAEAVATKTAELRQQAREHFEDERVQQSLAVARERERGECDGVMARSWIMMGAGRGTVTLCDSLPPASHTSCRAVGGPCPGPPVA